MNTKQAPQTDNVTTPAEQPQGIVPWEGGPRRISIYTTLPPEETLNLMVTAGRIRDAIGKVIHVTDVIVHRAEVIDADGEPQEARRTVLVCGDQAFACVADGVLASLELIVATYGPPPWINGLDLIPTAVETRRGFTTLRLVPPMKGK